MIYIPILFEMLVIYMTYLDSFKIYINYYFKFRKFYHIK